LSQQLQNFTKALGRSAGTPKLAVGKAVIFLDEFPWLNTQKSGFLPAFDHWWNSWGNTQPNIVVVICGSAASWMIKNIVNSRGGLHNRITRKIRLLPFTLSETAEYLQAQHINLERYHLLQLYMVMGGIPHYLKEVKKGESAMQAIDRRDFAINICEMKFTEKEFTIDKGYAGELENKRAVFKQATGTKKSLFLTLVTTFGVQPNEYFINTVQASVTMDALFE
jgi:predicted AAA+ superfamily ATPase